jgi:hypothetical protein
MINSPFQPGKERRMPSFFRKSASLRFVITVMVMCGVAAPAVSQAAGYSVQQVQAVFLFNFAQFVKWPSKAFPDSGSPLTIGVLGANPFSGTLENAVRGETVDGRRIAVRYSRRAEDLKDCQIVFVSQSESGRVVSVLGALQGTHALTVSDIPRFCEQGGMINFMLEGGQVKFSINTRPANNAGLQISSKLLRLAK